MNIEVETPPPVHRGRPREFCVDRALSAALQVFWTKGYEGASLSELTDAMGITRPSLYAAFGNKEALFRKALDLYEREKLAFMAHALEAPTLREVVERMLRAGLAMQTAGKGPRGCFNVVSTMACGAEAEAVKAEVIARRASAEAAMMARLERARAEGDLPPGCEPEGLVRYIGALMQGMAVQAGTGVCVERLGKLVETALALWPQRCPAEARS